MDSEQRCFLRLGQEEATVLTRFVWVAGRGTHGLSQTYRLLLSQNYAY